MSSGLRVVVGLGKTGLSCVRHLVASGMEVAVTDSRVNPPGLPELQQRYPSVVTRLGRLDEELLTSAREIIISPGVSRLEPVIAQQQQRGISIIGDIELFAQAAKAPIVGITGSNGKSSVTTLVGHLASQMGIAVKVGGNLGTPALELLGDDRTQLYVLELSSFQLESTFSLQCRSAVNLNISPDHMDRYSDLASYAAAKLRIYRGCDTAIINLDDPLSYPPSSLTNAAVSFTLQDPGTDGFGLRKQDQETFLAWGDQNLLSTRSLLLKGSHQYANVLAALAIGASLDWPLPAMLETVATFSGLPHRCQWIRLLQGVDWYNDSKATNVGSTLAAIRGMAPEISGKLVIIAGGVGKKADFSELYSDMAKHVKALILFGQDKLQIAAALNGAVAIHNVSDLTQAVSQALEVAREGDAVLLSPACASFDMFDNFEHRGDVFMELVRGLKV